MHCLGRFAKKHSDRLIYQAFDLLYLDGRDLRGLPLLQRKHALAQVLPVSAFAIVSALEWQL